MIWDLLYYLMETVLNFIYEVINLPFQLIGLPSISDIMISLKINQIYGFISDMIFPPGLGSILLVYLSTVIIIEMIISVVDRRREQ